jgi:hypothetical protein
MTTGQISCYLSGQIENSRHRTCQSLEKGIEYRPFWVPCSTAVERVKREAGDSVHCHVRTVRHSPRCCRPDDFGECHCVETRTGRRRRRMTASQKTGPDHGLVFPRGGAEPAAWHQGPDFLRLVPSCVRQSFSSLGELGSPFVAREGNARRNSASLRKRTPFVPNRGSARCVLAIHFVFVRNHWMPRPRDIPDQCRRNRQSFTGHDGGGGGGDTPFKPLKPMTESTGRTCT